MNTSTVTPEIATFAQSVRAALADLSAEEVDDLTEGLEADLAESLAEDLRRTLPDPVAYAAELRLAAGLPGRTDAGKRGIGNAWDDLRRQTSGVVQGNPTLAAVADFLEVLRPAWWVLRAWIAAWLLAALFGMQVGYGLGALSSIPLLVFAVVSIQWGRGRWQFPGLRGIVVAGNVIAVVALLPVVTASQSWDDGSEYNAGFESGLSSGYGGESEGLFFNGQPLENIYVYDAAGQKLSGVQLFDVQGRPLVPNREADDTQIQQTPATLETGAEAFNVYPLQITRMTWDDYGDLVPDPNPDPGKVAAYADGPFIKVPAVLTPPAAAIPPVSVPEKVAKPND